MKKLLRKLKTFTLGVLMSGCGTEAYADTPPQVINKQCSAHTWFSQIQPGPGNINCTQPNYSDIGNALVFINSITQSGLNVSLLNDSSTPGNTKYYGTNSSGTKGYFDLNGAVTSGNLTDTGTDGLVVTNGSGAVLGSGTSLAQHVSDTTHNGYLASIDWNTFNNKQPAGNYITALTTDVVAAGPGSVVATIQPNVVSNSKLAQMGANTVKANMTGSTANASDVSLGTVTEATSSVLTLTGWGDATIGSPTIQVKQAGTSQSGYLSSSDWNTFNSKQATLTIGTIDSQTASANGAVIASNTLVMQSASSSVPGLVNNAAQNFSGAKTMLAPFTVKGDGTNQGFNVSATNIFTLGPSAFIGNAYHSINGSVQGLSTSGNFNFGTPLQLDITTNLFRSADGNMRAVNTTTGYTWATFTKETTSSGVIYELDSNYQDAQTSGSPVVQTNDLIIDQILASGLHNIGPASFVGTHVINGSATVGKQLGVGGATSASAIINSGATNPLTGTSQEAFSASMASTSAATVATEGFVSTVSTAASAYTTAIRAGFDSVGNTAKGAGSTITRDINFLAEAANQGTNNCILCDSLTFSGNFAINLASTNGSVFGGSLTAPAFISSTANVATVGQLRLAQADFIAFRNSGNSADIHLQPGSTDLFISYAGRDLVNVSDAQTLTNKSMSGSANTFTNIPDSALSTPYIKADGTRALTGAWNAGAFQITANSVQMGSAANTVSQLRNLNSDTTLTFGTNGSTTAGSIDASQQWTLGVSSGSANQTINGLFIANSNSATPAGGDTARFINVNVGSAAHSTLRIGTSGGGSAKPGTWYNALSLYSWAVGIDTPNAAFKISNGATEPGGSGARDDISISNSTGAVTIGASGSTATNPMNGAFTTTKAVAFGGGSISSSSVVSVSTSPLSGTTQQAFGASLTGTSGATNGLIGFRATLTGAASTNIDHAQGVFVDATTPGATSTITWANGIEIASQSGSGITNSAEFADNHAYSGNFGINITNANPSIIGSGQVALAAGTVNSAALVDINNGTNQTALTGSTQEGLLTSIIGNSSATSRVIGEAVEYRTQATSFTAGVGTAIRVLTPSLGAGSTVTRNVGILFQGVGTAGTNNAIIADSEAFGGNWGIYISSTNTNFLGGQLQLAAGSNTAPSIAIDSANSGFYSNAGTDIQFTTNGTNAGSISSAQKWTFVGGIVGVTSGSSAASGIVGEVINTFSGGGGSPAAQNAGASNAYADCGTITLTAGDWDLWAGVEGIQNGATGISEFLIGIGTATGNNSSGLVNAVNFFDVAAFPTATVNSGFSIPEQPVSVSGSTTYYVKQRYTYSTGTPQCRSTMWARRRR